MQGILDHGYDGNGFWTLFGAFSLIVVAVLWRRVHLLRRIGRPVELRPVIVLSSIGVAFAVLALIQVLEHPWSSP